jgi:hypothetical protein
VDQATQPRRRDALSVVDDLLGIDASDQTKPTIAIDEVYRPVTIERTSKQYKLGMLIGWSFMALGVGMLAYSLHVFTENFGRYPVSVSEFLTDERSGYVALGGILVGFVLYRIEVLLAWWNNG